MWQAYQLRNLQHLVLILIGKNATGDLAVTTKSATVGNVTFNLRGINNDNGTVRKRFKMK